MQAIGSEVGFIFVRVTTIIFREGSIIATGESRLANVTDTDETRQAIENVVQTGTNPVLQNSNVTTIRVAGTPLHTITSYLNLTTLLSKITESSIWSLVFLFLARFSIKIAAAKIS